MTSEQIATFAVSTVLILSILIGGLAYMDHCNYLRFLILKNINMDLKTTLDGFNAQIKKIQAEQQKRFDDLSAQIADKLTDDEKTSLDALGATIGQFDADIPDTDSTDTKLPSGTTSDSANGQS